MSRRVSLRSSCRVHVVLLLGLVLVFCQVAGGRAASGDEIVSTSDRPFEPAHTFRLFSLEYGHRDLAYPLVTEFC